MLVSRDVGRYSVSQQLRKERLSKLLIEYCAKHNLSGNRLAKVLQVSQTSAQAYLDGVTFPGEDIRRRIADLVGMTFEELKAKLDNQQIATELSVEDICQEIRAMDLADFLQVYQMVAARAGVELSECLSLKV